MSTLWTSTRRLSTTPPRLWVRFSFWTRSICQRLAGSGYTSGVEAWSCRIRTAPEFRDRLEWNSADYRFRSGRVVARRPAPFPRAERRLLAGVQTRRGSCNRAAHRRWPEPVGGSHIGSAYGAAFSNLWYPDGLNTVGQGFLDDTSTLGGDAALNVSFEFKRSFAGSRERTCRQGETTGSRALRRGRAQPYRFPDCKAD